MPQKLQRETLYHLKALGSAHAERTFGLLKSGVQQTYTEGEGVTADSLQMHESNTQSGFQIEFLAGGRALVFLTAMAGLPFASPGHLIPQQGTSRFFWRNPLHGLPPGMYSFTPNRPAFWQTRQKRDVITEVLNAGAVAFGQVMIAEHNRILVNFVQNDLQNTSKSPRVSVEAGSGIEPQ